MKFLSALLCCLALVVSEDPFLEGADLCEYVDCPVGTACGETGECVPFPGELEQDCPPVRCMLACEFGFKVKNGCPMCACEKEPQESCLFVRCPFGEKCDPLSGLCVAKCPRMMCMLACEHGFESENDCPICACRTESLELLEKESEEV